ncbi:MAG: DNA polymerase elongation subunit (family B) [Thermoplasmata archaeon]|nr:DNA polymerase elongation subunit (family B) [Thermoplasmata archaeon]
MLINVSPSHIYWKDFVQNVHEIHQPYFLVIVPSGVNAEEARRKVRERLAEEPRFVDVGDIEEYSSFWNFERKRKVFRVFVKHPSAVPELSDRVFNLGYYTAEHDIPYHERVLTDLASQGKWIFDSDGREEKLSLTVYDIELTKFGEMDNPPIDIIGYSTMDISFISQKDLDSEEFFFDFVDIAADEDVKQLIANDENDEIKNLIAFSEIVRKSHIVAGHNIMGFDNLRIYSRMKHLMRNSDIMSPEEIRKMKEFLDMYMRSDQSFHFGSPSETAIIYPSSFDTYLAARKFYTIDDFSLDGITKFLGINIEGRLHLTPAEMAIDDKTILYNTQDVMEEVRLAQSLLQQGMPLAFITGMPFELLFPAGATKMWDYMAMIRAARHRKIMPPVARVYDIAKRIGDYGKSKEEIADNVRRKGAGKEIMRVVKYGEEMPDWVEYPYLIFNKGELGYHFPGGMTIKPDRDANSHFIPWYHVIVADVGAMYPTILRAINAGGDTVMLAEDESKADEWVWLKKLPSRFLEEVKFARKPADREFMDRGWMVGIRVSKEPGLVNMAMKGIMNFIDKIKKEMKEKSGEEYVRLKMMYQSLKAARNAGTHGILSAPMVSCRQFNLWGAALITTMGQQILYDTLKILENNGIRVVYGDTDGIYVACSRAASPELRRAVDAEHGKEDWIVEPQKVHDTIEYCNRKWQERLNYRNFELEPEEHEAMIFVKHKNYLIFDVEDGKLKMVTKGNNFKGSDKPDIARIVLYDIMKEVLKENIQWRDEEEARENVKKSIKKITMDMIKELDIEKFGMDAFTLVQSVQPASRYKPNPDGSMSVYGERAKALEKLVGKLNYRRKFKFVITKHPLPGVRNPTKSGVKPIHYMYPVELVIKRDEIDMDWYKEMIKNFVQGAFGLSDMDRGTQYGLDRWM